MNLRIARRGDDACYAAERWRFDTEATGAEHSSWCG
jgi:hypothetical protein